MSGDKAHWRILNDAGSAGGTNVSLDNDGILDAVHLPTSGTSYGVLYSHSIGRLECSLQLIYGTPNITEITIGFFQMGSYELYAEMELECGVLVVLFKVDVVIIQVLSMK